MYQSLLWDNLIDRQEKCSVQYKVETLLRIVLWMRSYCAHSFSQLLELSENFNAQSNSTGFLSARIDIKRFDHLIPLS